MLVMEDRSTVYVVTLKSVATQPTAAPPAQRLKALLKVALRSFGLRCVSVRAARDCKSEGQ